MSANANKPRSKARHRLIASLAGFLILTTTLAHAQITLDGSMGTAGALTGPNYTIPSTVGQTRGGNLFHGFGLFIGKCLETGCAFIIQEVRATMSQTAVKFLTGNRVW